MADYYSLLARKIGSLPQSTPQGRQAVYELARRALFNQLRAIQPPVAEAVIQSEGRALDEAIARLEGEAFVLAEPAPRATPRPSPEQKSEAAAPQRETQPQRPAAPTPALPDAARARRRVLAVVAVLVALVGVVALAALQFRERPEDLAKLNPDQAAAEAGGRGKFSDRISGDETTAAVEPSLEQRPAVPVAQKAEFYVAAPQHPEKVEHVYSGSIVWRLENVGGGEGETVKSAIRGDAEFPEAKIKLALVIQKNMDATLSASHTVNVSFKVAPDSVLKGVKVVGMLQSRRADAQSGEKIVGIPVPITANNFLIGLMRGENETRNVSLLRSPSMLDLPMQLSDDRMATINLEKGATGERVFNDAINSWSH